MIYPTVAELNLLLGGHQIPLTKLHGNVKQLEGRINIMILVKGYKYAAIIIAFGLVATYKIFHLNQSHSRIKILCVRQAVSQNSWALPN